jgi:hypothetical protein
LKVVKEGEWKLFSELVVASAEEQSHTPPEFFGHYYWGNIIDRAVAFIRE